MGLFFRGWKHKSGVLTLVTACLFTGLWIRSFKTEDLFQIGRGQDKFQSGIGRGNEFYSLHTDRNGILCLRNFSDREQAFSWLTGWHTSDAAQSHDYFRSLTLGQAIQWQASWGYFEMGQLTYPRVRSVRITWVRVCYLTIITPLTALSAWLLLSKPRDQK